MAALLPVTSNDAVTTRSAAAGGLTVRAEAGRWQMKVKCEEAALAVSSDLLIACAGEPENRPTMLTAGQLVIGYYGTLDAAALADVLDRTAAAASVLGAEGVILVHIVRYRASEALTTEAAFATVAYDLRRARRLSSAAFVCSDGHAIYAFAMGLSLRIARARGGHRGRHARRGSIRTRGPGAARRVACRVQANALVALVGHPSRQMKGTGCLFAILHDAATVSPSRIRFPLDGEKASVTLAPIQARRFEVVRADSRIENTMGNRLYVGNLSFNATTDSVREAFTQFGEITDVHVVMDRETGQSRGFGFVTLGTNEAAQKAIREMNGALLDGRALKVNEAEARQDGGGGGGGGRGGGGGGRGGGGGGRGGGGGGGGRW